MCQSQLLCPVPDKSDFLSTRLCVTRDLSYILLWQPYSIFIMGLLYTTIWALKLSWLIVWSLVFLLEIAFLIQEWCLYMVSTFYHGEFMQKLTQPQHGYLNGSLRIHCLWFCGNLKRQYIKKNTSTVNSFRLMRALCDCWIIWHDNNLTFGAVRMRQKDVAKVCF